MTIETLTEFFKWTTIIHFGLLLYMSLFFLLAPNFIYRIQSKWFPIPRETWNVVVYAFIGGYKLIVIACSLVPWLALLIIG